MYVCMHTCMYSHNLHKKILSLILSPMEEWPKQLSALNLKMLLLVFLWFYILLSLQNIKANFCVCAIESAQLCLDWKVPLFIWNAVLTPSCWFAQSCFSGSDCLHPLHFFAPSTWITLYLISMGLQYNHHRNTRVHKDKGNLGASDTFSPPSSSHIKLHVIFVSNTTFLELSLNHEKILFLLSIVIISFFAFHSWYEALSLEINFLSCWNMSFWASLIKW